MKRINSRRFRNSDPVTRFNATLLHNCSSSPSEFHHSFIVKVKKKKISQLLKVMEASIKLITQKDDHKTYYIVQLSLQGCLCLWIKEKLLFTSRPFFFISRARFLRLPLRIVREKNFPSLSSMKKIKQIIAGAARQT